MSKLRKFGILATGGLLGFVGYHTLASEPDVIQGTSPQLKKHDLQKAIVKSQEIITKLQKKASIPGVSVAVSVNGNIVWREGFGYRDLENHLPCTPNTVMKIASVSKCITGTLLVKEFESGKLDLDADITKYVPQWPNKLWQDEKVKITARLLASHMGGIRGYKLINDERIPQKFRYEEYHLSKKFNTVMEALSLFVSDPLVAKPGLEFHYSNHGFTLLSAALEKTSNQKFVDLLGEMFKKFGMKNTFVDSVNSIIYERSRHYSHRNGIVVNAPHVESSFKIAAAGLASTASDLVRFANVLLSCYQLPDDDSHHHHPPPSETTSGAPLNVPVERYLKKSSVEMLWHPIDKTSVSWSKVGRYGLGWQVVEDESKNRKYVGHTGSSIGISSVLMISLPREVEKDDGKVADVVKKKISLPFFSPKAESAHSSDTVVVAILSNLDGTSLGPVAIQVADLFV